MKKLLTYLGIIAGLCFAQVVTAAPVTPPYGGGTGISTSTAVGNCLQVLRGSTTSSLQYTLGSCGSGGGSITFNGITTSTLTVKGSASVTVTSSTDASGGAVLTLTSTGGSGSSTNVSGVEPILVTQTGVNATTSFDTSYALSLSALYSFLKGATINGTTTLGSTTNTLLLTNGSGQIVSYAGSNPCTAGQAAQSISATGTISCIGVVTSTLGNWSGTWQGVNSSTFYLASNPSGYITTSTFNATGTAFYFPYWNSAGTSLTATSSIFISSSTGNVGIGTTGPVYSLDVKGSGVNNIFNVASSSGTSYLNVASNGTLNVQTGNNTANMTFGNYTITQPGGGGILNFAQPYNGAATFQENQSGQSMTLAIKTAEGKNFGMQEFDVANVNGRLGQFYSDPGVAMRFAASNNDLLDLNGFGQSTISSTANWTITSPGVSNIPLTLKGASGQTSDLFDVASSTGTVLVNVTNAGNVGIGTSQPSSTLHVVSNTTTTATFVHSGVATTTIIQGSPSSTACSTFYTPSGTPIYSTYLATGQILTSTSACN